MLHFALQEVHLRIGFWFGFACQLVPLCASTLLYYAIVAFAFD